MFRTTHVQWCPNDIMKYACCCVQMWALICSETMKHRGQKSHMDILCCAEQNRESELSQLHEIILILDSLQWQRAFWMWCLISQLFNMSYQPTTCQTLTIKMSETKISRSLKERSNLQSEKMNPTKLLLSTWTVSCLFQTELQRFCCFYCFSCGWQSNLMSITPPNPKQSFTRTARNVTFDLRVCFSIVGNCSWAIARRL